MKKLVLSCTMLLSVLTLSAQEYWNFGVKGGVNFANLTGDGIGDTDGRTSFNVGALVEIPVSDKFSVQPEVLYSAQGFTAQTFDEDNTFDTDDNVEFQLDYISVPLLAKVYLIDGLSIQAGPSFNFLVSEELDYAPQNDGGDIQFDEANSFEFGGAAGVEYKFNNGFLINGRYCYGFTEVYDDSEIHNSVFQLGIGYLF